MATARQIEANRKNAALSKGPTTPEGKAASRANALKHGMASENPEVEAARSPAFQARLASWSAEYRPVGDLEFWAMDRAVAASFRIERCEINVDTLAAASSERAQLAWHQDRSAEAAKLGAQLAANPSLVARKLETTSHGVSLMIQWWDRLDEALVNGEDWTEDQAATALDLIGIPTHLRSGRLPIDDPEGGPSLNFRRKLAREEVERLQALRQGALEPLDELAEARAISGRSALLEPSVKLALRYEREAWRAYRASVALLAAPLPSPSPEPVAAVKPQPLVQPEPPVTPTPPSTPASMPAPVAAREVSTADPREVVAPMVPDLGDQAMPKKNMALFLLEAAVAGTNPILRDEQIDRVLGLTSVGRTQ